MTTPSADRFESFREALRERARNERLRSLEHVSPVPGLPYVEIDGRRLLNFSSNDYLGLSSNSDCVSAAGEAARAYGVGGGASRLIAGSFDLHAALEVELAEVTRRPHALLFNSGFQANSTIIPAVTRRAPLVVCDEGAHNSLIQGCRLSPATSRRFRHNDPEHLDSLLGEIGPERGREGGAPLVVTESLFSMEGDRAPLGAIAEVAERHGALLMVDDAHAFGVLGSHGGGLAADHPRVDLLVGTFGKALGAAGAFVSCNEILRDHLVNFCAGFIYTTAPPPPTIAAVRSALRRIRSGEVDLDAFSAFVRAAHARLRAAGFDTSPSDTHIVPIRMRSDRDALACAAFLRDRGILTVAIRPPTVPEGGARIRISLGRGHTSAHLDQLVEALQEYRELQRSDHPAVGAR